MNLFEKLQQINTFIFDVDGVLTNTRLIITEDGRLLRTFDKKDAQALSIAVKKGYRIIVITGGKSEGIAQRLTNLGIDDVYYGVKDKFIVFEELVEEYKLDKERILYMGDDFPDYDVMKEVGFPTCPSDAAQEIKDICTYISPIKGGEGAVRDVISKALKLQDNWQG